MSREMSEDENVMLMIKEADAKFNAKRASLAEVKEACMKILVQQQQENTQEDFKEKYMDAVESIGHLETEKVLLMYQVERLRDVLEGTEEELAELHWNHQQITRELEKEKVAKYLLLQKMNCMQEQLEERKITEAVEMTNTNDLDQGIQSNLKQEEYSGARKMELKSADDGMQQLWSSTANLADGEQKHLTNTSFEAKHNMQGQAKILAQRGADDVLLEESTRLIKAGENMMIAEKVNHVHHCEAERSTLNNVMEGSGSETFEPVKVDSERSDSESKGQKEEELIFGASRVSLEESAHNETQSDVEAREQVACDHSLSNAVKEGERKQIEQKKTITMEMPDGTNLESTDVYGSIARVPGQDHGVTPRETRWEGTKEWNREAISSGKSDKDLGMDCKAEDIESGRKDILDGVGRADDEWIECGRNREEVTNPFQSVKATIPSLAKDGVSANLKQDLGSDEEQQHGKVMSEENKNPVKSQETDGWLQSSIDEINQEACSRRNEGKDINEKASVGVLQEDNADEGNEMNVDLDAQEHNIGMGGSVQGEGKQTHNGSNTEENNGEREKSPLEMFVQLIRTIITQKNLTKNEGQASRKDDADDCRSELRGERDEEIKEQNEEHQELYVGEEKEELGSPGDGYGEKRGNDMSGDGPLEGTIKLTGPEGRKAAREFVGEAEGVADDLSDEEMHDAAESMASEPKAALCDGERKPDTEDDPENTPEDKMGFGQSLNRNESIMRHMKNKEACRVS